MKIVQDALKNIGIPVFPDAWRPAGENQSPPAQYCVYTVSTTPSLNADDGIVTIRHYVYLNLWSEGDPTVMAARIRRAMFRADFEMLEEETGSSSSTRYDESTRRHAIFWTWARSEEDSYGDEADAE